MGCFWGDGFLWLFLWTSSGMHSTDLEDTRVRECSKCAVRRGTSHGGCKRLCFLLCFLFCSRNANYTLLPPPCTSGCSSLPFTRPSLLPCLMIGHNTGDKTYAGQQDAPLDVGIKGSMGSSVCQATAQCFL